MNTETITLATGQGVPWPASPTGYAQVEFLHRRLVTIGYRRGRRWKRRRVRPDRLVGEPLLFPLHNPFNRAVFPRSRTFTMSRRTND